MKKITIFVLAIAMTSCVAVNKQVKYEVSKCPTWACKKRA